MCAACKHLGLVCEYKRPMWWSNTDARRKQKEDIKLIIKRKKLSEKASHNTIQTSINSPPGLTHSLPTSATFSDPNDRTRSGSVDSQFAFNFNSSPSSHSHDFAPYTPQMHPELLFNGAFPPYEVDVKTERQMFVNDVSTLRESTTSTFSSAYPTPTPAGAVLPSFPLEGEWTEQVYSERHESLADEAFNPNPVAMELPYCAPPPPEATLEAELGERDQQLFSHFIQHVLPTIFPVLESSQLGPVGSDLILPALQNNPGYRHCCLSIAGQHYKAAMGLQSEEINSDIMRHRYATISWLCESLNKDEDHQQILEAALGLIFFQCCVGRFDDALPDIPWHQHFQAAVLLVQKLDLPQLVSALNEQSSAQTPFNMTLTSWIDILGATMHGRVPTFAHTYREKHLSATNSSLGLRELMGCDDRIMYLISEIACLEALKKEGMDDITLCQHVHVLGDQIGLTEMGEPGPEPAFDPATGMLDSEQLTRNMTAAFRIAARIYLCSLVPGFSPAQASCMGLVERLASVLQHVPSGPGGFDRCLAWAYLVGGSVSTAGSAFRTLFDERVAQMGEAANLGSFGRVACLLREVWAENDLRLQEEQQAGGSPAGSATAAEGSQHIHWRDMMQMKGWDFLLI